MKRKTLAAPKKADANRAKNFWRGQSGLGRNASQTMPKEMTALMMERGYEI
jgi:hypothetical protein